eukprot:jgi/Ulvmu1/615/UM001_0623.1
MTSKEVHQLPRRWCLKYSDTETNADKNPQGRKWTAHKSLCSFDTVEGFWRLFSNIVDVSDLDGKRDFMLFEDGIEPDWDDPGNEKGGLWLAHSSDMALNTTAEDGSTVTLHTIWLDTVMRAIGEQFPQSGNVVGVALNIRKNGSRLALWTRTTKTDAVEKTLGRDFKAVVRVPVSKTVGFSSHEDSKTATANGKMYWSSFRGTMKV